MHRKGRIINQIVLFMIAKKLLFGIGATVAVTVSSFGLIASAQTASSVASTSGATLSQHMIVQVGPAGKVLLRGIIDSVSNGSLTVKSWGGDWTVNVSGATQVLPVAVGNDLTQFKAGDFVGVQGTVSQSASWTIDAMLVRDWTYRQQVTEQEKQNMQAIRQTIQSGTPRNYVGTASAVSESSLTLTGKSATYTVNVVTGAQVVNKNWLTLPLSSIQNGDNIRVWGINASGTITAQIVRDISIPVTQKTTAQ